ncbi:hypothetical protein CIRMBP1296_00181 [Enterococcus cecorum]|nr:hypothetical protein CIRMBP1296_00181 [Enterococcus cecorum]
MGNKYMSTEMKYNLTIFWSNVRHYAVLKGVTPTELLGGSSFKMRRNDANINLIKVLEIAEYLEIEPDLLFKKNKYVNY